MHGSQAVAATQVRRGDAAWLQRAFALAWGSRVDPAGITQRAVHHADNALAIPPRRRTTNTTCSNSGKLRSNTTERYQRFVGQVSGSGFILLHWTDLALHLLDRGRADRGFAQVRITSTPSQMDLAPFVLIPRRSVGWLSATLAPSCLPIRGRASPVHSQSQHPPLRARRPRPQCRGTCVRRRRASNR